jgi:predicted hydrocarbon binding protein
VLVEEKRIPSMLLSILFTQVEELMGRRSLIMLLRQAELAEYIDNVPSMDDTPSITVQEYSKLLAIIYDIFGARGARPIFLRGGQLGAKELRHQRPAQFAFAGTALKLLPSNKRMQIVLDKLAEQGSDMYGATYRLHEKDDAFFLEIANCPYCAEITRRSQAQNKTITKPVCHIPAAIVDEMIEWVTGQKHLVEEVACIAQGAPACSFRIGK